MENVKYTTDGKKVVVIGNLNAQEKIVQEVFIANEQEVPSGENFVVKNLHDSPSISWKEKRLKDIESEYDNKKSKYEREIKELEIKYREKRNSIKLKNDYLSQYINNVSKESFDTMSKFLEGKIKYLITSGFNPRIIDFDKIHLDDSFSEYSLKLITLFGKDDGTLQWGINRYNDGSGSSDYLYGVACDYEEAREILNDAISKEKTLNDCNIKEAKKHNIKLCSEKLKAYKDKRKQDLEKSIDSKKKELKRYKDSIKEIDNL